MDAIIYSNSCGAAVMLQYATVCLVILWSYRAHMLDCHIENPWRAHQTPGNWMTVLTAKEQQKPELPSPHSRCILTTMLEKAQHHCSLNGTAMKQPCNCRLRHRSELDTQVFTVCRQCQWEALCMSYWAQLILNKAQSLILVVHEVLMGDPFCSLSTQQNGTQSAFFCVPRQVHISLKTSSTFEQQCPGGAINTPLFAMTAHNSFHSDNTSENEPTFTENIA